RARASARGDGLHDPRHAARRARAPWPGARLRHAVRGRRHGHRDDHRKGLKNMSALEIAVDERGIATATMNQSGRSMNVLDDELGAALADLVERLETAAALKGVILVSGKPDFLAGADIDRLRALTTAQEAFDESMRFKAALRRMERAGKPVVAVIWGKCLGG